jgi:hypothetical protein
MSSWLSGDSGKIDSRATNGLAGASNSLAYRVHEIEKHFHNREFWFGLHSSVSAGVNEGEEGSVTPFTSVIGTGETWGAWIPLLGTSDTPAQVGYVKFDIHRLLINNLLNGGSDPNKQIHLIQLGWGATGAAALSAGDITNVVSAPERDGKAGPVDIMIPRIATTTKVFLRHRVVDNGAFTDVDECSMEFFIGIHEYAG